MQKKIIFLCSSSGNKLRMRVWNRFSTMWSFFLECKPLKGHLVYIKIYPYQIKGVNIVL